MGIATITETDAAGGDYRWLRSARGTEHPRSGTLDVAEFTPVKGVIPSGTPVKLNAGTGLYEPADSADTIDTLAGFVWHDRSAVGVNQEFALLTDATIIASLVPGDHDLVDGRYQTDAIAPAGGDTDTEGD